MHTAPAHGMDDYQTCIRHKIESRWHLVDERGRFNADAGPRLEGKEVLRPLFPLGYSVCTSACLSFSLLCIAYTGKILGEGSATVLSMLGECQALLASSSLHHRCPIDWRTKKQVIVRETVQWFADVSQLRERAAAALETVQVCAISVAMLHFPWFNRLTSGGVGGVW